MIGKKKMKNQKKGGFSFNKRIVIFVIVTILVIFFSIFAYGAYLLNTLPSVDQISKRKVVESTKIYDRTGTVLLYEIHGEEKRTIIPFGEIPDSVKKATIALEDQNFYSEQAFNIQSILRAFIANAIHGKFVQGGSTITQQLARNAFLTYDKTINRKLRELFLAIKLDQIYSKDEILNLYLNEIPYGSNAYGIEAASETFFNKKAKDLTLGESALLASLARGTTFYSPYGNHVKQLFARQQFTLSQMKKMGFISEEQEKMALNEKIVFAPQNIGLMKAPHFIISVEDYLSQKYGEDLLQEGGLKITTTLDWNFQQAAENAVKDGAERNTTLYQGKNAALVAEDPTTGQILSLVGSKDYFNTKDEGNFNVATQGMRQPGSSIKPFVYLTAFTKGYTPDTVLFDVPTNFDTSGKSENSYTPENYDHKFRGPIDIRNSLAQSINIPAVKTLYLAGLNDVLDILHKFGIHSLNEPNRYGLSLALGGGEITLYDLVGAYSVLATDGVKHSQTMVLKVERSDGKVLEEYRDNSAQVINPEYPRLINDVLSDTSARAPLFQNSLNLTVFPDRQIALKTGTTNDYRDAWTFGYTPSLVVGVWAGNNDNKSMIKKGGSILAAVPIWHDFMSEALKTSPYSVFTKPDPLSPSKPILRGDYLANKQIHTILYYVNKDDPNGAQPINPDSDPQFKTWEEGVLKWAKENISDFNQYNNPLTATNTSQNNDYAIVPAPEINILSPLNGSFIDGNSVFSAEIKAKSNIKKIEFYFNDQLIDKREGTFDSSYSYQLALNKAQINQQNSIVFRVYDSNNSQAEKNFIVFSNQ